MKSDRREVYPGIYADEKTAKEITYEPAPSTKGIPILSKLKLKISHITYWIGWKISGPRIWNRAVLWAAEHVYLASALDRSNKTLSLPMGITVADERIMLESNFLLDGHQHFFVEPVNKRLPEIILIPPGTENITIKDVHFVRATGAAIRYEGRLDNK